MNESLSETKTVLEDLSLPMIDRLVFRVLLAASFSSSLVSFAFERIASIERPAGNSNRSKEESVGVVPSLVPKEAALFSTKREWFNPDIRVVGGDA